MLKIYSPERNVTAEVIGKEKIQPYLLDYLEEFHKFLERFD